MDRAQGLDLIELKSSVDRLASDDWSALTEAFDALERETLAVALTKKLGRPLSALTSYAPTIAKDVLATAVQKSLEVALRVAVRSLGKAGDGLSTGPGSLRSSHIVHRAAVMLSGAAGGALGLATLPIELPISTTLMLRSIASTARSEGEDLADPQAVLACLEVFALGGASAEDWETGYFAVRAALAQAVGATLSLGGRTALDKAIPALGRFMGIVASRFGAAVGQKIAAQSAPVLGAAGGAAVNLAFMQHFQTMAKAHFTVRRLERQYGAQTVREAYQQLSAARAGDNAKPIRSAQ